MVMMQRFTGPGDPALRLCAPQTLRAGQPPLSGWLDLPSVPGPARPLVAIHGISRDARAIRAAFRPLALAGGRALLTPRFRREDWPKFQRIGTVRPDLALLTLLDQARAQAGLDTDRVALFGYSGGAQLVHRFAMLYPQRIAALHVAAAGWYCLPDPHAAWPAGLRCGGRAAPVALLKLAQLDAFLRLPVRLYVGALDTGREAALRQDADLDERQGPTRLDRAQTYLRAFADAARMRGIAPDISLTILPNCGHDFTQCARIGGLAQHVCAS